jgi:hypothetical protein
LIGLADIVTDWGRPHHLRLCVAPAWQGKVEGNLMRAALRRLRRLRGGNVWFNYPVAAPDTETLIESAGFQLRRSLTVMRKNLAQTYSVNK